MHKLGPVQKKLLLLLLGGLALGLTRRPDKQFKIIKTLSKRWREIDDIDKYSLQRSMANLYRSKLISCQKSSDGAVKLVLTGKGKNQALIFNIDRMKIKKPRRWDKVWRLVIFDIPERIRRARDILRFHLKQLGFYELQKSVFIYPYPCQKEIEFLVELYNIRKYVRFGLLKEIDNDLELLSFFDLLRYRGFD